MTVSIWQADDSQPLYEVDVLIIGAGLAGCAAAYFATQMGHRVVVTEMRDVGLGASSRNAGFMITGPDTYYHRAIEEYGHETARELWKLSERTHSIWRGFIRDYDVPFQESGSMLLAECTEEAQELEQAARALNADGIHSEYLSSDPLKRGYFAAVWQPWDGAVHPYKLALAVLHASGATLVSNNEVYRIEQPNAEKVIVWTRQYRFEARHVMLCTNAYSPLIHPYFVGKVVPTRAQCLVTAPLPSSVNAESIMPVCGYSDYGYMYYRMTFDNRLLIGGGRKQNKLLENDTTDDRITDPVQRHLDSYLRTKFPDVDVPVDRRWAGIMGFSVDGLPIVGTSTLR